MRKRLKGDTLIEVMLAVAIFGLAAVGTISLMNKGLATSQTNLEVTMARQEIDAQAEALRFIHDAYLYETSDKSEDGDTTVDTFRELWKQIIARAYDGGTSTAGSVTVKDDGKFYTRTVEAGSDCDSLFTTKSNPDSFSVPSQSFVLNVRKLDDPSNYAGVVLAAGGNVRLATTYPRILYGTSDNRLSDAYAENNAVQLADAQKTLSAAEGIWVTAIASEAGIQCNNDEDGVRPDYYDFIIQTCWDTIGGSSASTISSTVRLYNPDQIHLGKKSTITFANTDWKKWDSACNDESCSHNYNCGGSSSTVHVDTSNPDRLILTGFAGDPANLGTYLDLDAGDDFSIDLTIKPENFYTHPYGYFIVKIGPLLTVVTGDSSSMKVRFVRDGRSAQDIPSLNGYGGEGEDYFTDHEALAEGTINGGDLRLHMEKSGTSYSVNVNDSLSANITDNQSENLQVAFWMVHEGHCCSNIYKIIAEDIHMEMPSEEEDGCFHVGGQQQGEPIELPTTPTEPTEPEQPEEPQQPEPEPEPEPPSEGELPGTLEESSIFVVMTWDDSNSDIDAHLKGGPDDVHIWYLNKTDGEMVGLEDGSSAPQYNLDVDALDYTNYDSSTDSNCGTNCGDGYMEVVAIRNLEPGTYEFYADDFAWDGLKDTKLKVRIYAGFATAGIGQFPRDKSPLETFKYNKSDDTYGQAWYVCDIKIKSNGTVVIKKRNKLVGGFNT